MALVDEFSALYAPIGRPSIPPEKLLRATLLQAFYSILSELQLVERLEYDLLFRWFVGIGVDAAVWDHSVFSRNRDRLLEGDIATRFLAAVLDQPRVTKHGLYDPNFLAYLLLCRTRSNFAAAILLTKQRMIVEARTLARCCFENAFLVAGLREQGRAFADRMKEDDEAGCKTRLKFARDSEASSGKPRTGNAKRLSIRR